MGVYRHFPYTNFHEMNLDEIIKIVKELVEDWAQYHADWDAWMENINEDWADYKEVMDIAFQDLHDYVYNYFENLDVQDEIDNKMDKMLMSGLLLDILQPFVPSAVSEWLNDNITEPVGVVIDTSLSVAGACADAKVTGDAISRLDSDITYNKENLIIEGYTRETDNNLLTQFNRTNDRYISLYGTPYSSWAVDTSSDYNYYTLDVAEGERYTINAVSYNNIKGVVLVDSNDDLVDYFPKANSAIYSQEICNVHIPAGVVKMLVTDKKNAGEYCYTNASIYKFTEPSFIINGMDVVDEYNPLLNAIVTKDRCAHLNNDYNDYIIDANSTYTTYEIDVKEGETYEITGISYNNYKSAIIVDSDDNLVAFVPRSRSYTQTNPTTVFTIPENGVKMYAVDNKNLTFALKRINCVVFDVGARSSFYNPLYLKKLCSCGDSLTAADTSTKDTRSDMRKSYAWFVAERNAMTYVNMGVSGETLCSTCLENGTYKEGFSESKYATIPADSDFITLFYGWNDEARGTMQYKDAWCVEQYGKHYSACTAEEQATCDNAEDWLSIFIGTDTDNTCHTWYGGWNIVLDYIRQNFPNAKVGVILPYVTTEIFRTSLINLCKMYGVSWIDGADPREWFSTGRSFGLSADMQTYLRDTYTVDGLHPNELGHKMESDLYEAWIRGL